MAMLVRSEGAAWFEPQSETGATHFVSPDGSVAGILPSKEAR
jgi:hypothetical protein